MKKGRKNCLLFILFLICFSLIFSSQVSIASKKSWLQLLLPLPVPLLASSPFTVGTNNSQQVYISPSEPHKVLQIGFLPSCLFHLFPHLCFHPLLSLAELSFPCLLFWFPVSVKPLCSIKSCCVTSLLREP